jgi:mitochondrial-processing peptidase subunit beta
MSAHFTVHPACVCADKLGACACADVAESIGRELLVYGRRIPKAELFARIDAVDADTIRAVADRFLYDQDAAIAAVGDTQFLPDYNWFRRRTYWLRY